MANTNNTITLDQQSIEQWRSQGYDYNEALGEKTERVHKETKEVQSDKGLPDVEIKETWAIISVTAISILVCIIVGYVMYKYFGSVEEKADVDFLEEDTIYGIDFVDNIKKMEQEGNYYQCLRLKYLELLRKLHDSRKILWLPSKTPTQYAMEMSTKEFRDITNIFMKIRYGNYPADAALYADACKLYDTILTEKGEQTNG